ncbi:MAG: hypothetical protein V1775_15495 [Bacteroidota bacterium]
MRVFTILTKAFILLFLTITFSSGCEKKNDPDLIPSYLRVEKIGLTSTFEQGTTSHKITDAWVYLDETLIGVFELPATVPILTEGEQKITIRPGIKINGIANTRTIYPFFTDMKQTIVLVRDSVVNFSDTITTYSENTVFPWIENFDFSGITLDTTSNSTVAINKINDPDQIFHYPGENNSSSAFITMTNDTSVFESISTQKYDFPNDGTAIFLELNFKTNHPLVVGVFYTAASIRVQRPLLILNKTDQWNKIYVNLTVPVYDTPSARDFQVFFGAQKEDGTEEAKIYLDNIKLVHF